MNRRQFLQSSSALSLPILLNGIPLSVLIQPQAFRSIEDDNDKVLVLIQLQGGNDGLNTLIPLDQYDNLANVRSNIIIPESKILPLSETLGFHPSMSALKNLYSEGKIGLLQSVGYPNQNRSHFRSTDIWNTGSAADEFLTTGWVGRYFDTKHSNYPDGYPNNDYPDPFALSIGYLVSETCQGYATNYSLAMTDPAQLGTLPEGALGSTPNNPYGEELTFLRQAIQQTNAYSETIINAANNATNLSSKYEDNNNLAQQLKVVAQLVAGGLQTKVYVVSLGGFDTHANQIQGETTEGDHANLLARLSTAVEAFQDDLKLLGLEDRVLGVTISEFGRKIRSNFSNGTDHGTAAPLMLFGSCVNPTIIGDNPTIDTAVGEEEGVPMQYDFRSVYGSILIDWFGVEESQIRGLLYDDFQHLPILSCRVTDTTNPHELDINLTAYPNPFDNHINIKFSLSQSEQIRLSIYNTLGHEVKMLSNRTLPSGTHDISIETHNFPSGHYYYRIQAGNRQKTGKIIKL